MVRMQIELTSARPDGSWTWRAAGARQPKGSLAGSLLPAGAKVGDVLRVEAEVELEGTVVTAVLPETRRRAEPERLEILGPSRPFETVTTSLLPKGARPRRSAWDGEGQERERAGAPRRPAQPGRSGAERGRTGPPRRADGASERRGEPREAQPPDNAGSEAARPRSATDTPGARAPRSTRRAGDGAGRGPAARPSRTRSPSEHGAPGGEAAVASAPRPKRLVAGNVHRSAVLESLPPEQRPIAEQVLQGGLPAVRRALQEQNAAAAQHGQPEVPVPTVIALAEELLPRLKTAEWRDRAEAAVAAIDDLALRDLRSVVAGSEAAARDDDTRMLAKTLREALDQREAKERQAWLDEITGALAEGRLIRALRVAARPPDPRTRFPAELAAQLSDAAGAALAADVAPERWLAVLEAVLDSPVRRSVKPAGLPTNADEALLGAARRASGRVPALAAMLGIDMPPPPGPVRRGSDPARPPRRVPGPSSTTARRRPPLRSNSPAPGEIGLSPNEA